MDRQGFADALLDPDRPAPAGLVRPDGAPAPRRFDVYRNNVVAGLGDALLAAFPTVTRLLGEANMKALAPRFVRAHPPATPVLQEWGDAFPDWIGGVEEIRRFGYLGDVARLDLGMRRAYHAADAAPVPAGRIAALDPDALAGARIGLAPAAQILRSPWPVHAIWRRASDPSAPRPPAEAQDVLITRPGFDPRADLLPSGGADFVAALARGETLADAAPDGLDLAACLGLLLQGGAIASLEPERLP